MRLVIAAALWVLLGCFPAWADQGTTFGHREPLEVLEQVIASERARLSSMPPARDDGERIIRMVQTDQLLRRAIGQLDFATVPEPERAAQRERAWALLGAVDQDHQRALLEMLPESGWFRRSDYGAEAAHAAFLIVQHGTPELWERFLPIFELLVQEGEVGGQEFALLFDRFSVSKGRPQRYGTQFFCRDGFYSAAELEDPSRVDERRASLGIPVSFADQERRFAARSC